MRMPCQYRYVVNSTMCLPTFHLVDRCGLERNIAMSKVVAIMSMSLDGYVADRIDGVAEVFDWYFNSGDVEVHTGGAHPMTFKVSGPSAGHDSGLPAGSGA